MYSAVQVCDARNAQFLIICPAQKNVFEIY